MESKFSYNMDVKLVELWAFYDDVWDWHGEEHGCWIIDGLTRKMIRKATRIYINTEDMWDGGDTIDREKVFNIILRKYNLGFRKRDLDKPLIFRKVLLRETFVIDGDDWTIIVGDGDDPKVVAHEFSLDFKLCQDDEKWLLELLLEKLARIGTTS